MGIYLGRDLRDGGGHVAPRGFGDREGCARSRSGFDGGGRGEQAVVAGPGGCAGGLAGGSCVLGVVC